jgi:hypothetical protein
VRSGRRFGRGRRSHRRPPRAGPSAPRAGTTSSAAECRGCPSPSRPRHDQWQRIVAVPRRRDQAPPSRSAAGGTATRLCNPIARCSLLLFYGCRSGAGADRTPAGARSSSNTSVAQCGTRARCFTNALVVCLAHARVVASLTAGCDPDTGAVAYLAAASMVRGTPHNRSPESGLTASALRGRMRGSRTGACPGKGILGRAQRQPRRQLFSSHGPPRRRGAPACLLRQDAVGPLPPAVATGPKEPACPYVRTPRT